MEFISKKLDDYCKKHTSSACDVLEELNRETHTSVLNPRMISGNLQGQFLTMLSRMMRPKCILEIGTYTGYSAISLAEGIKNNGELHTIDINEENTLLAKKYFKKSDYNKNIIQHIGNALDIIPTINKKFQLVFIDADKENYSNYFDLIVEKLDKNGIIIADNVLWSGKVILKDKDTETLALDNYNKKTSEDSRVENLLIGIRDGLMISRKIK